MSAKLALRQIGNQRAGGLEHIRLTQLVETKINKKVIFCCFSYCFKDIVINPVLDIDILKAHKITFFFFKKVLVVASQNFVTMSFGGGKEAPSGKSCIWDALRDLLPFVQFKKREKTTDECYF